ncbi:hypothetical protein RK21_04816 [Pseudomonas plecoglossicida]|nr:hypothetical protein RK21_04816 [Pseudomonas plecoglossicida]
MPSSLQESALVCWIVVAFFAGEPAPTGPVLPSGAALSLCERVYPRRSPHDWTALL